MITFPKQGLEEKIVDKLQKGPLKTKDLIQSVKKISDPITVQGIYKSLRSLKKEGIVLMEKKEVMINQFWLQQMEKFTSLAKHAYRYPISDSGHFLQMEDGDRITYRFKDPVQVDVFWNHILYILFDAIPNLDRWYAYSSHCWFLLARRKDELSLKEYMNTRGIKYLFTVGHNTLLDKIIRSDFDGVNSKYHMLTKPLFIEKVNNLGIVLNIVGDYIIQAQYDKVTTDKIEKFYKTHAKINKDSIRELEQIVANPGQIKFVIMRNAKKANKLAKLFEKNFYWNSVSL